MRSALLAVLLAACATTPVSAPPDRVAGCWIDRGQSRTLTLRWQRPDAAGILRGDLLEYGVSGTIGRRARYALAPQDQGWAFCVVSPAGENSQCWQVAEGESGSLEGGRVFIDRHRENLRIAVVGAPGRSFEVFEGQQDGCD